MSNANRDYAIVYDVKNSSLVLSRPLNFYITDKNTSNIFIKLVTRVIVGNGIDQYTDIENASNYVLTMRVIKPNNEVKSLEATQHEPENIFQFDLTEDFKDIPGKYICELTISAIVSSRQELITSDPFIYEVKRSILSNVGEIIETEDTTVEKLLNNLDATKAELSSQIKDIENKKVQCYNNIATMKSDKLKEDIIAITLGYYEANDGGGGVYKIRTKGDSESENGGSIIEVASGLVAELVNFKPNKYHINVNQWGILPNGENVSEKINNIFSNNPWTNDLILYFPSGTYTFETPLSCSRNSFTIIGDKHLMVPNLSDDHNGGTYFKITAQADSVFLDFVSNNCYRNAIKNIAFYTDAYKLEENRDNLLTDRTNVYTETITQDNFSCIKLNYNSQVENCYFKGFSGTAVISTAWNHITACSFESCKNAIKTGIDSMVSDIRFAYVRNGVIINGSANLLNNLRGDSIFNHGLYFDNANGNCTGNYVNGVNLDFCYYAGIVLDGTGNVVNSGVLGRVATFYGGQEYNEDTIELEKASGIYIPNVLKGGLADCKVSCVLGYNTCLDGSLTEEQAALKSPIVKIGIQQGFFNNFEFDLKGSNSLTEVSTTNPSRPITLNEMKRVIAVNKSADGLTFRGVVRYKCINYYFTNLETGYEPKKIITDYDLPFVEKAWNGELSSIVTKSGVINKHEGDNNYYISKLENGVVTWIPLTT